MKLSLEINGRPLEADFQHANGAAQLTHDGQTHAAQVSQPEPGLYVITLGAHVYRCVLDRQPDGSTEVVINNARRIPIAVRDKKRMRGGAGAGAGADGRAVLIAPMPGKIVRVLVEAGAEVTAGQGILIVEAMKMQNEVQAPKAGKVMELKVAEGQTVNAGETLAVIE